MKNRFIYGLVGLSLLGACNEGAKKEHVDSQDVCLNIKQSDLNDTLLINRDSIRKEYEKAGSRGEMYKKDQCIIDKIIVHGGSIHYKIQQAEDTTYNMEHQKDTIHEGTIYPEIEKAMLEAATYYTEYRKDTINGKFITARGEQFLDMPAGCFFMLELINNKWVTYQDLLNAANNHDISSLAAKVFGRSYPEGPLTLEQEEQKREDEKIFIRMALYVCLSDTYDVADEQIHWIQETRGE